MARYVVVEFDSNEEADAFVQQAFSDNKVARKTKQPLIMRVVGVFVKPVSTCVCFGWERGNVGAKNWAHSDIALGEKFGWWVCTRCNKPRRGGHQLNNQIKMSETYEGHVFEEYEFGVTGVQVTGIHTSQLEARPKKLRRKKK